MTIPLEQGWRRVELVPTNQPLKDCDQRLVELLASQARLSPESLRTMQLDPHVVQEYRRHLAVEGDSAWLLRQRDHEMIGEVARRVATGRLRIFEQMDHPIQITLPQTTGGGGAGKPKAKNPPGSGGSPTSGGGGTPGPDGASADDPATSPSSGSPAASDQPSVMPEPKPENSAQCSAPACKDAFEQAANDGTALIEADAPGCGKVA